MKRREFIARGAMASVAFSVSCSRNKQDEEPAKSYIATAENCASYEEQALRRTITDMVDRLGGLRGLRRGDRVLLKVNLTGGAATANTYMNQLGIIPWETYWTHGEVIRIIAELYRDVGASRIWVADALFGSDSYALGGYREKLAPLAGTKGLGQSRLADITYSGPDLATLRFPFTPCGPLQNRKPAAL
jgi:hypothetical protein